LHPEVLVAGSGLVRSVLRMSHRCGIQAVLESQCR
jgi:hypothetical protein